MIELEGACAQSHHNITPWRVDHHNCCCLCFSSVHQHAKFFNSFVELKPVHTDKTFISPVIVWPKRLYSRLWQKELYSFDMPALIEGLSGKRGQAF